MGAREDHRAALLAGLEGLDLGLDHAEGWTATQRWAAGLLGAVLVGGGLWKRGWRGGLSVAGGVALAARAVSNISLRRTFGIKTKAAVEVRQSVFIAAPVERVFSFWANTQNLSRVTEHVLDVRETGINRTRWTVMGPARRRVHWEAVVNGWTPNRRIAWTTVPGSLVQHTGQVIFTPLDEGTRVDLRMRYNPGAGGLGHMVAKLFGVDPALQITGDLDRIKAFLEGRPIVNGMLPGGSYAF